MTSWPLSARICSTIIAASLSIDQGREGGALALSPTPQGPALTGFRRVGPRSVLRVPACRPAASGCRQSLVHRSGAPPSRLFFCGLALQFGLGFLARFDVVNCPGFIAVRTAA